MLNMIYLIIFWAWLELTLQVFFSKQELCIFQNQLNFVFFVVLQKIFLQYSQQIFSQHFLSK